jgi:zinc-ribbon domain
MSANLTPCPDCGREVSKTASKCPQCGRELRSGQRFGMCLAMGILAVINIGLLIVLFGILLTFSSR